MTIPFWHVDAFASSAFGGNPAGVCLLDKWLQPALMRRIAAENNLPETAFVMLAGSACELRWFTPTVEMDLCGHATLAAGHVLFHHRGWRGSSVFFGSPSRPSRWSGGTTCSCSISLRGRRFPASLRRFSSPA